MSEKKTERQPNRYQAIIAQVFADHYSKGEKEFEFMRDEVASIATTLKIKLPKNIGDIFYSFRYRNEFPDSIRETAANGLSGLSKVRAQPVTDSNKYD